MLPDRHATFLTQVISPACLPGLRVCLPVQKAHAARQCIKALTAFTRLPKYPIRAVPAGVYAAHQCVTALAVGADYLAPYLGRMDEAGKDVRPRLAAEVDLGFRV